MPSASCIGSEPPHPSVVAVVDELEVLSGWNDADRQLGEMVELARAVGVHLVLSTGSLSPEILTPRLRTDIPARLVFRTQSQEESEVLLGESGSERLQVAGEALFLPADVDRPVRLRCPLVPAGDVASVVRHWAGTRV